MDASNLASTAIYVLVQKCPETGMLLRVNTAPHTLVGKEELQKQADRRPGSFVQTEWEARQ